MTPKKPPQKAPSLTRNYTQKTLKVLFALSGNQCAYPKCTNTVIEPATEQSDAHVSAQICHIYAISADGPRGKSGLTQAALNAPDNLILLCSHHHGIVDGQHETYPADTLKQWKQTHEAEMQKRLSANLEVVQPDVFSHPYFPTALVDQKIEEEIEYLRKRRFFREVDRINNAQALARRIVDGELNGGTDALRSRALAWCARLLANTELVETAEEYVGHAKRLNACTEIQIAEAVIASKREGKEAALKALAPINSPPVRAAALTIVTLLEGGESAIAWLKDAGLNADDLDSEGKLTLLTQQLELARWEDAEQTISTISDHDLEETPALHRTTAITLLARAVPEEFRANLDSHLPLDPANFSLISDARSMEARRSAQRRFSEAAEIERDLCCPKIASLDDEFALWLELRDPDTAEAGRQQLEDKLRDPELALQYVPLGLAFGIEIDIKAVEKDMAQHTTLHGGATFEVARTRLSLAITRMPPREVTSYIDRHYDELSKFFDPMFIGAFQVEALIRAGMLDKAEERLSQLLESGLPKTTEGRLRNILEEVSGADPVVLRKKQFEQTNSLIDLENLIDELQSRQDWQEMCTFAKILFERVCSVENAEKFALALTNAQESAALVELLRTLPELCQQSKKLQMHYCWALFYEGHLLEARSELIKLNDEPDDPNFRSLSVSLGIAMGDWPSLLTHLVDEYQARENRNASDLMQAAQLAHQLGSPHARDLTYAAASKGKEDPGILVAAYLLATTAGWEDDETVGQWIQKAAELSGENGPLQKVSLKDFVDQQPEWNRHETETWKKLGRGEIPMVLAGEALNRTLVSLILFPAYANPLERDPRRRGIVPAYSGQRSPLPLDTKAEVVGMDATALLTLSFLGLLEKALDALETVYVPHSTLFWLFEEKQRAAFHQPSRIKDAQQLRDMVSTGYLKKLASTTVADSELSAQVGEDLAIMIAEAKNASKEGEPGCVVVRPSPVHRITSLMEEEADLTEHYDVLVNCLSVVDKLRRKGQITANEYDRARAYLRIHEKPWPRQPDIPDGAMLYLDDLAIRYFLHLDLLDKLNAAGFTAVASLRVISESNALMSYVNVATQIDGAIEQIRNSLNSRIESGKIKVGKQRKLESSEAHSIADRLTLEAFALAGICDALIIDDRFLNDHPYVAEADGKAAILTTFDLLDALESADAITFDEWMEKRTLLRRGGYCFVPVGMDELAKHLNECIVENENVYETAELKAIRENLLRVRMSDWLQLPEEANWLDAIIKVFIRVLQGLWTTDADLRRVKALSDWLLGQVDIRGWAHRLDSEVADDVVKKRRGLHVLLLLAPLPDVTREVQDAYWEWVEDRVLTPIKEQFPDLYEWIVELQKQQISDLADMGWPQGGDVA